MGRAAAPAPAPAPHRLRVVGVDGRRRRPRVHREPVKRQRIEFDVPCPGCSYTSVVTLTIDGGKKGLQLACNPDARIDAVCRFERRPRLR
jgi:hypothetical protein